jgi:hypothetical protein
MGANTKRASKRSNHNTAALSFEISTLFVVRAANLEYPFNGPIVA